MISGHTLRRFLTAPAVAEASLVAAASPAEADLLMVVEAHLALDLMEAHLALDLILVPQDPPAQMVLPVIPVVVVAAAVALHTRTVIFLSLIHI